MGISRRRGSLRADHLFTTSETELRKTIKTGGGFDSVCRTIPGLLPWIGSDKSDATTEPFGIGQIHAVWRDYLDQGQPQILNFFAVGDRTLGRTLYMAGVAARPRYMHTFSLMY
ncbi:MAG: hypothetical protein Ct9H90mP27_6010 [Gammaproteobacteria bacterium]|nr:MAG: hypothetical protein Ct9H90mP27_6010 [Gammaproteobacteria bacterium]